MNRVRIHEGDCEDLPRVCIVCGQRADRWVHHRFVWHTKWVYAFIGFWLIAALIAQRTMHVDVPLCRRHTWHWTWKTIIKVVGVTSIIVLGIAVMIGLNEHHRSVTGQPVTLEILGIGMAGVALIAVAITIGIIVSEHRRPFVWKITDRFIHFEGVSSKFMKAVERMP